MTLKPREKFKSFGIESLSDAELIGLLIGSGVKNISFEKISNNVANYLLRKRDSKSINIEELTKIKGVGNATATKLLSSIELGRRINKQFEQEDVIRTSVDAVRYFNQIMSKKKEYVMALYLNGRYGLLHSELLAIGSLSKVSIIPRDIIIPALECNAAYIIVGHNHPSGVVEPSRSDLEFTKRVYSACEIIGLKLLEHLVVAKGGKWSSIPFNEVA